MKKNEVPQDKSHALAGETKTIYALDESGKVGATETSGWDVEDIVLDQALEELQRHAEDALVRAQAGKTSPLEFHMYKQRMDLPMLAQATGQFQWQVRRHFDPRRFAKLSAKKLNRYAEVLDLTVDVLKELPEKHE
ncbi:MAG TPA: hypothetical protein EYH06_01545 [Chromatiales bacterium]|nr:hypothetical protein [Thiotrichales bacterium]HIP67259.1 hypothetical protein [Chromatiales bacterium]